jgi:hypothetical protein
LTLAPIPPASPSNAIRTANDEAQPAATESTPQAASPLASTMRSPIRSASSPHGSNVKIGPIQKLESTSPICVSDRS